MRAGLLPGVHHASRPGRALQGRTDATHDTPPMTDYDLIDLIADHTDRLRARLRSLDNAPERYDQRLTQCFRLVLDAEALLEECDA